MIRPRFDVEATVVAFQLQHFIGTNFTEIDNHVISICSHMHAESTHQEGVNGKQGELHCDDCAGGWIQADHGRSLILRLTMRSIVARQKSPRRPGGNSLTEMGVGFIRWFA
jgi:hypothetical protein